VGVLGYVLGYESVTQSIGLSPADFVSLVAIKNGFVVPKAPTAVVFEDCAALHRESLSEDT
jgi:hypothetical protein